QPSPPRTHERIKAPPSEEAAPTNLILRALHARKTTATQSAKASRLNAFLTPAPGIRINPVSSTPATAPRVFHVNKRPTRLPKSSPRSETSRIQSGKTAPIKAAGKPRIIIENPPAMV